MKILFVCRGNIARSQIAQSLLERNYNIKSKSAGTSLSKPELGENLSVFGDKIKHLLTIMNEENIDFSDRKRKSLTPEMVKEADKIIVMAELETIPDFLDENPKVIYWGVEDPKGKSVDKHREVREQIKTLLKDFVEEYNLK